MEFRKLTRRKPAVLISIFSVLAAFTIAGGIAIGLSPFVGLSSASLIGLVVGEALIIVPALLYIRSHEYSFRESFRLNKTPARGVMFLSALIAVSMQPVADEVDRLISWALPFPDFLEQFMVKAQEALTAESLFAGIAIFLGAVLFAALSEEALFRGFLQKSFETESPPLKAVLISSLVFAFVHFSPQFIQIFLIGILLGYMALRTDSLIPCIIVHLLNNGMAIAYINLGDGRASAYLWENHVSPLFLIPSIVIFIFAIREFHKSTAFSTAPQTDDPAYESPDLDRQ